MRSDHGGALTPPASGAGRQGVSAMSGWSTPGSIYEPSWRPPRHWRAKVVVQRLGGPRNGAMRVALGARPANPRSPRADDTPVVPEQRAETTRRPGSAASNAGRRRTSQQWVRNRASVHLPAPARPDRVHPRALEHAPAPSHRLRVQTELPMRMDMHPHMRGSHAVGSAPRPLPDGASSTRYVGEGSSR